MHIYSDNQEDADKQIRDYLVNSVDKMKKVMTKKNNQPKQAIDDATLILKTLGDKLTFADKFYELYRQLLISKQPRLIEIALYDIQVQLQIYLKTLFNKDLFNGNTIIMVEVSESPEINAKDDSDVQRRRMNEPKRLINCLLEQVVQCQTEKEEMIQILMIKAIQSILTSNLYHVYGDALTNILSLLINIYSVSKVNAILLACKTACTCIVQATIQKLELFGSLSEDEHQLNLKQNGKMLEITSDDSPLKKQISNQDDFFKPRESQAKIFVNEFMRKTMTQLVDEVCIYEARCDYVAKNPQNQQIVPSRLVPSPSETNSAKYKNPITVDIENEKGIAPGKFGWCIMSRQAANSYCKDSRIPVCTKEQKFQYLEEMILCQYRMEQLKHEQDYVSDARDIIDMLSQLSQKEEQNVQLQPLTVKCRQLSLELIYEILNTGGSVLFTKKAFGQVIKESLLKSLLRNSLSQERQIFIMTLNIFVLLAWYYRDRLRVELEQIIENVYFRILDSPNSSYDHKQYTLKVFNKIFAKPRALLELFVNYDCTVGSNNLVERILENQCKIIQGKYSRIEFQTSLLPSQDIILRSLSLVNMGNLVKQLRSHCDEFDNEPVSMKKEEVSRQQLDETEPEEMKEFIQSMEKFDQVEKQRQMKLQIQKAVQKFNYKPELGLKYLIACGYMKEKTVTDVARFFKETPNVSKDKMGEYFGSENEFNQKVFSEFVDMIDLPGLSLDDALRVTLEYFTLPGVSEQIDRIVQTFASKYVQDNPGSYASATAAYTFSYLLMMLQTDLHNPLVFDKMSLPAFISLARGINDGENLPVEALNSFYSRIQKQPLAQHAKEKSKKALEQALLTRGDLKKKHDLFVKEAEKGFKKGSQLRKDNKQTEFIYVNSVEYVKPLMEILWSPLFAAYSVVLERSEDNQSLQECFEGINHCVRLLGRVELDQEKDTFIIFMQKFCQLQNLSQLQNKQILAVQTMLSLAITSGQFLKKSWRQVLQLVSRLDYLNSMTKRVKQDADFFSGEQPIQKEQFNADEIQQIERLFASIDSTIIDKVFIMSVQLDADSMQDFIEALCDLSKNEISTQNRVFLLSKVVEVADSNMKRVKIVWAKIWDVIKAHFWEVGSGKNADLAIYAIDQLKQLSCKFMQQPELANYQFQKEFLLPFEQIFLHNQQTAAYKQSIREYILSCMSMITNLCCSTLKSGWKIIMAIVLAALLEDNQNLVRICVKITDKMMTINLESILEVHMELIQSLIKLTKNSDLQTVVKAINHLHSLIQHIAENSNKKEYKRILDQIWIPILSSLSILYSDPRVEVQQTSVKSLFSLLRDFAGLQTAEFWKMILRGVIRPLFDEIQFAFQATAQQRGSSLNTGSPSFNQMDKDEKQLRITTATLQAQDTLKQFTLLLKQEFLQLQPCFSDVLDVFISLVIQNQDTISSVCMDQLTLLVSQVGQHLSKEDWGLLLNQITHLITSCAPTELLEVKDLDQDFSKPLEEILQQEDIIIKKFSVKLHAGECLFKTNVQNSCVKILLMTVDKFIDKLPLHLIEEINKIFHESYIKSLDFNQRLYMRYFLWRLCGYRSNEINLPGFQELEQMSVSGITRIFYHNQEKEDNQETQKKLLDEFIDFSESIVKRCIRAQQSFIKSPPHYQMQQNLDLSTSTLKQQLSGIQHEDSEQVMLAYMLIIKDTVLPQISQIPNHQVLDKLPRISEWLTTLCKIGISNPSIGQKCSYYSQYNEQIFNLIQRYLTYTIEKALEK